MKSFIFCFTVLLCVTGCGKRTIYDYELERTAKICGGYDKIKSVWIDLTTVRAYCTDGKMISPED